MNAKKAKKLRKLLNIAIEESCKDVSIRKFLENKLNAPEMINNDGMRQIIGSGTLKHSSDSYKGLMKKMKNAVK